MNYQIMEKMKDYEPDFDSLLFHLPLAGSAFKKIYYDKQQEWPALNLFPLMI